MFRRALLTGAAGLCAAELTGRAALADAPALIARREMAVQIVDFGWRRDGGMFDSAGPGGAVTNEIYTLETAAQHVRFRFQNGLAAAWTIGGAAYAPTAAAQSNPVDGAGRPVALAPVTFGNGGRDVALADQAGAGATSLTLPAASAGGLYQNNGNAFRGIPNVVFSDWMPITTLARQDGGPGALVMLRVWSPSGEFTGVRPQRIGQGDRFQGTAARPWRAFYMPVSGDAAALLTGPMADPPAGQFASGLCCGVQAIGPAPGLTLLSVGDSVLMGGGELQGYLGPIKRAADLMSTPALPVSHIEAAMFGSPSGAFLNAGRLAIRTNKVSCAFIQVLSGNDPHGPEAATHSFDAALGFADECRAAGALPVFLSPGPPDASNNKPGKEQIRLATMARLEQLSAQGYPFLNLFSVLADNGVTNYAAAQARPNIRALDHVHLNSAGDALVAGAAVALLRGLPVVDE